MKNNKTAVRQIFGLINTFLFMALIFTFAANAASGTLAGHWAGSFQTPGPAGSLEITLTQKENDWIGEVKIEGPGNKILTKDAQNLKVEDRKIVFMIEIGGAEITFTGDLGDLKEGKLVGELVATEDGKTVGMGSWEMARSGK
jgi:hypothetical protein